MIVTTKWKVRWRSKCSWGNGTNRLT